MAERLSRRTFLKVTAATTTALALGPTRWGWSQPGPFGPLQDDPLLRLPVGFSYQVVGFFGMPLTGGRGPYLRPHSPDLNVVFPRSGGRMVLSTSHEVPSFLPATPPPPAEEYDRVAAGAVTSLLLNPDLSVAESAFNAGGMTNNCSGSATPWGTVLTGEEDTATLESDHGFVWEVDIDSHTKTRLDACGRFEHETAVVDRVTGFVYLTEDSGTDSLLYRLRPATPGRLADGGILEAFVADGTWVTIDDPLGESSEPAAQGIAKGALQFARLEGGRFDGRYFYFTETADTTVCGRIWRLQVDTNSLEVWAEGSAGGAMCMPDNVAFDAAGNIFVTEDREGSSVVDPNRILFVERLAGSIFTFAELVVQVSTPGQETVDEPTGPAFSPDGSVLFLNLQRGTLSGLTLAITGPFAEPATAMTPATPPISPKETKVLAATGVPLSLLQSFGVASLGAAAALVALRRRGRISELPDPLEDMALEMGHPSVMSRPKRPLKSWSESPGDPKS